jgi:hypothetical protein
MTVAVTSQRDCQALPMSQAQTSGVQTSDKIPQSVPCEPMSELSDDPISLYAQSDLDVCYANDPFSSTEVDSCLPTEDILESFH